MWFLYISEESVLVSPSSSQGFHSASLGAKAPFLVCGKVRNYQVQGPL